MERRSRAVRCAALIALFAKLGVGCGGRAMSDGADDVPQGTGGSASSPSEEPSVPADTSEGCDTNPLADCEDYTGPGYFDVDGLPDPACFANPLLECNYDLPASLASLALLRLTLSETLIGHCGDCHDSRQPNAGAQTIDFIGDLDRLMEEGWLVRCSPESSPLLQVINDGSMPPGAPLDQATRSFLSFAMTAECDVARRLCAAEPTRQGCSAVLVEELLDERCGSCHGRGSRRPGNLGDGMTYIDDLRKLTSFGAITPCSPEQSLLLQRVRDGSMPPSSWPTGALTSDEIGLVSGFINSMCTPFINPEPDSERLAAEEILRDNCGSCHGQEAQSLGSVQGGFGQIESSSALLDAKWIVPCSSRDSLLLERVRDGTMPPDDGLRRRLSQRKISTLAEFIDRPCLRP
jgi:hypothetical protein